MDVGEIEKIIQFLESEQGKLVKSKAVLARHGADSYSLYAEAIQALSKPDVKLPEKRKKICKCICTDWSWKDGYNYAINECQEAVERSGK